MLLNTNPNFNIDTIKINFDTELLWIVNIALAIVMFGVSLDITITDFKRLFKQPKILFIGVISQFLLFPAVSFLLVWLLQPHPSLALGMLLVASCPGGNISNFYSKMASGNAALSVSLTAFATLVSVIATPLNLSFWASKYEPTNQILQIVSLNPYELAKLVVFILGIPLLLGMFIKHNKPKLAVKLNKFIKPFSLFFLIILIVGALLDNSTIFKKHIHLVFFLVLLQNILGYILGFSIATLGKLNAKDRKTITFETGIQNSGLGLLLVFSFFKDLGGLALIVAFWGVWDMVSGLLLAWSWNKKESKQLNINSINKKCA